MSEGDNDFRMHLQNDPYFGEALHEQIHEEVARAAEQFERDHDTDISDEEIRDVAKHILNGGHAALSEDDE